MRIMTRGLISRQRFRYNGSQVRKKQMIVNIIAAVARNRAIGKDNRLLYWLPNDLKRFKALTTGHTVIMGRRTFESLPKGALPNRRNIVLTRTKTALPGCECFPSLEEALAQCRDEENVFIIGGEKVYRLALKKADRLYLTEIDDEPEDADAFFPNYDNWVAVKREDHDTDEKHLFRYSFADYERPRED